MHQTRDELRAESLALLDVLKDIHRPQEEREHAFERLLDLPFGFWRHDTATTHETLKGFVKRSAKASLEAYRVPPFVEADDISQQALTALFCKACRIRTNPRAWLRKVTTNLVLIHVRHEYGVHLVPIIEEIDAPSHAEEGDLASTSPQLRMLRKAVNRLPEKTRAIVKAYRHGETPREIAQKLQMTEAAVRQQWSRARRTLKTYIQSRIADTPAA